MKNSTKWVDAMNILRRLTDDALGEGTLSGSQYNACLAVIEKARHHVDYVEEPVSDDCEYDSDGELL